MIQLIDDQRDAWAVAEDVAGFIGTSQAMLWRELVIEDIEDGSKARSRRFMKVPSLQCDSCPSEEAVRTASSDVDRSTPKKPQNPTRNDPPPP